MKTKIVSIPAANMKVIHHRGSMSRWTSTAQKLRRGRLPSTGSRGNRHTNDHDTAAAPAAANSTAG